MYKRLYIVQVEFEFAALADSEQEACRFTDQVIRDTSMMSEHAHATVVGFHKFPGHPEKLASRPDGWEDDDLVYGADKDITLSEAIASEKKVHDEKQG